MGEKNHKVLIYGYGNPGRLDDGLGPALAGQLEARAGSHLTVDSNYQLSVEDAATVAEHDVVIFADAAVAGPEPFFFSRLEPEAALSFSSHSVEPKALLALAEDLFESKARGYALGIRGYEYNEFGERLSRQAATNLEQALAFVEQLLESGEFTQAAALHHWAPGSDEESQ